MLEIKVKPLLRMLEIDVKDARDQGEAQGP